MEQHEHLVFGGAQSGIAAWGDGESLDPVGQPVEVDLDRLGRLRLVVASIAGRPGWPVGGREWRRHVPAERDEHRNHRPGESVVVEHLVGHGVEHATAEEQQVPTGRVEDRHPVPELGTPDPMDTPGGGVVQEQVVGGAGHRRGEGQPTAVW